MSSVAFTPTKAAFVHDLASSLRLQIESSLHAPFASTLLRDRAAPLTVSSGIAALDALTGGLPRGSLSEIAGPASSGRTGIMLSALAGATRRQEVCALVDASDSFDPASAATVGVDLERLLWVRCNEQSRTTDRQSKRSRDRQQWKLTTSASFSFSGVLEQVLKVTDLLLQGGGFGMVVLDLGDIPAESVRRIPLTSWFRFRRAVEPTATVLMLVEQEACAKTCASLVLRLQQESLSISDSLHKSFLEEARPFKKRGGDEECLMNIPKCNVVSHADLLQGMRFRAEVVRSWAQRKAPQSLGAHFELRTAL
jgi:hypothetical protein